MMRYPFGGNKIREVAVLSSGTVIGQAIGLFAAPILTRLYLPSEFGDFAIYLNSVMLLSVIACLRYELTLVLVKRHKTAMMLVLLCIFIAGLLSLCLWIPLMAFENSIHAMVGLDSESRLLLAVPVSLMLAALFRIVSSLTMRKKDYGVLALSKIWQSVPQTVGQLSFGFLHFGTWGLVVGEIVGRLLGFLALTYRCREMFVFQIPVRLHRMRTLLSYYRQYPLYSTWSALINEAGSTMPVFCLAILYGSNAAGLFALVQRVFAVPMDLVGQTALTMYMAEASHAIRTDPGRISDVFLRIFLSLLALAAVPTLLLLWIGPQIFGAVFGHEWHVAGNFAQIMALAYGARLAVSPIASTMQMLGRQRYTLYLELTRFLSIVGVFASGQLLELEVEAVLGWYAVVLIACYGWMLVATWKVVKGTKT